MSALLSHRPGKEMNPSSAVYPSPPRSTPARRFPPLPTLLVRRGTVPPTRPDYAAVQHEDKGKLTACHVCALLPRPGTRQRAGPGAGRKARPGAAAPPTAAGTNPAGISQRRGGTRRTLSPSARRGGARSPRRNKGSARVAPRPARRPQGAAAYRRPAGERTSAPPPPRRERPGSRGRSSTCGASSCPATAEARGARGGSPPHPVVPQPSPRPKRSGTAPGTTRAALPRGGPL